MRTLLATLVLATSFGAFADFTAIKITKDIGAAHVNIDIKLDSDCNMKKFSNNYTHMYWQTGQQAPEEFDEKESAKFALTESMNAQRNDLTLKLKNGKMDKITDDGVMHITTVKDGKNCIVSTLAEINRRHVQVLGIHAVIKILKGSANLKITGKDIGENKNYVFTKSY